MKRGHLVCLSALFIAGLTMLLHESHATMVTQGDTLVFTMHDSRPGKGEQRIEKVVSFEQETKYEKPSTLSETDDFAANPGAVDRLAGKKFAVSESGEFAVILSYSCTHLVYAAENPWKCETTALIVDSEGYKTSEIKGDFLWVETHDRLPYFVLIKDFCCATTGESSPYTSGGQKICNAYLTPDDTDCGNLSENCNWRAKAEFLCEDSALDGTYLVDLEARLMDGTADLHEAQQ